MSNIDSNISYWAYSEGNDLSADAFDTDSAFEDNSVTRNSLASNVNTEEHRYENGRRYHSYHEGQYALPNDDKERERLDLQHHIFYLLFEGKLHMAPIRKDGKILDVGTGTGAWAIDIAETYPSAEVIGTDLSQIQPAGLPPNCRFEIDDCEDDWVFPKDTFEFVHMRYLNGSIKDWSRLFREAYKHTKPGGWIELQECHSNFFSDDDTLPHDSPMLEWFSLIIKASVASERPFEEPTNFRNLLVKAGYQNIQEKFHKLPSNAWPKDKRMKEIGRYQYLNSIEGIEGWSMALFTRVLGWEKTQVEEFLIPVKKEFSNRNVHAYWKLHVVWAQKPDGI